MTGVVRFKSSHSLRSFDKMVNIMQQKKMNLRKNKMEKGLSLIEASMVLALSAIVVSGVMFYYQSASDSNKTQNTISQVMSVMSAINGLYVGQASYDGLSDTVLYNSSAVPENYKDKNKKIKNPFGGILHVAPNLGTSLEGVGVEVKGMTSDKPSVNLSATPVSNNSVSKDTVYSGTLTPANAASLCTGVTNSITFLMK